MLQDKVPVTVLGVALRRGSIFLLAVVGEMVLPCHVVTSVA